MTMQEITQVRAERDTLTTEAQDLLRAANGADLTGDAATRFEEITGRLTELQTREERLRVVERALGDPRNIENGSDGLDRDPIGDPRDVYRGSNPWGGIGDFNRMTPADLHARAIAAIEHAAGMTATSREVATQKLQAVRASEDDGVARLVLATTHPDYVSAFSQVMRGRHDLLSTEERAALRAVEDLRRAMSVGTAASGGYLVPESLDPTLILNDGGVANPIRALARVELGSTRSRKFITSTAVSASYDGEAVEVSDDSTTLAEVEIIAHKAQAFIPYSIELGLVSNLTSQLAMLFADGKNTLEASKFTTGSGTDEPFGFITGIQGSAYEIASDTTDVLAMGDVYDLDEEMDPRYAAAAAWGANKKIYQAIREAGGANLDDFWANASAGMPGSLLGYPRHEISTMDGVINATQDNRCLILADWRSYFGIFDVAGLAIEPVDHVLGTNHRPTGQRGAYAYWLSGSKVLVQRAARLLNVT